MRQKAPLRALLRHVEHDGAGARRPDYSTIRYRNPLQPCGCSVLGRPSASWSRHMSSPVGGSRINPPPSRCSSRALRHPEPCVTAKAWPERQPDSGGSFTPDASAQTSLPSIAHDDTNRSQVGSRRTPREWPRSATMPPANSDAPPAAAPFSRGNHCIKRRGDTAKTAGQKRLRGVEWQTAKPGPKSRPAALEVPNLRVNHPVPL